MKQIAQVTDPGMMTTLMNPPPVGTGPAPPFSNAPCVTKQGPCQKDAADQFMMGIISEFQDAGKCSKRRSGTRMEHCSYRHSDFY